jgi:hypothetical protein
MSNCGCCCINTLNYCDQNVCGSIDFDIEAQINGVHKLSTEFLGTKLVIEEIFTIGENLVFPIDKLNENFQYTVELFDPNGAKIIVRRDDIDYDCFKFKTAVLITLNAIIEES